MYTELTNVRMLSLDTAMDVLRRVCHEKLYLPIAASFRLDHVVYADVRTGEVYAIDATGDWRRAAPPGVDVIGWVHQSLANKKKKEKKTDPPYTRYHPYFI